MDSQTWDMDSSANILGREGGVVDQENTSRIVGKEGNPWREYEWADSHCGQLRFVSTKKLWDTVYDPHRVVATWKYGELGCLFSHWWWGSGGRGSIDSAACESSLHGNGDCQGVRASAILPLHAPLPSPATLSWFLQMACSFKYSDSSFKRLFWSSVRTNDSGIHNRNTPVIVSSCSSLCVLPFPQPDS